jgi:hypothetical protein
MPILQVCFYLLNSYLKMSTGHNTTNLGISFAVYERHAYVLYETTGAGTGVVADDVFIKLTGVTTLPTFAGDVIA